MVGRRIVDMDADEQLEHLQRRADEAAQKLDRKKCIQLLKDDDRAVMLAKQKFQMAGLWPDRKRSTVEPSPKSKTGRCKVNRTVGGGDAQETDDDSEPATPVKRSRVGAGSSSSQRERRGDDDDDRGGDDDDDRDSVRTDSSRLHRNYASWASTPAKHCAKVLSQLEPVAFSAGNLRSLVTHDKQRMIPKQPLLELLEFVTREDMTAPHPEHRDISVIVAALKDNNLTNGRLGRDLALPPSWNEDGPYFPCLTGGAVYMCERYFEKRTAKIDSPDGTSLADVTVELAFSFDRARFRIKGVKKPIVCKDFLNAHHRVARAAISGDGSDLVSQASTQGLVSSSSSLAPPAASLSTKLVAEADAAVSAGKSEKATETIVEAADVGVPHMLSPAAEGTNAAALENSQLPEGGLAVVVGESASVESPAEKTALHQPTEGAEGFAHGTINETSGLKSEQTVELEFVPPPPSPSR